jgi:hypothetical protein
VTVLEWVPDGSHTVQLEYVHEVQVEVWLLHATVSDVGCDTPPEQVPILFQYFVCWFDEGQVVGDKVDVQLLSAQTEDPLLLFNTSVLLSWLPCATQLAPVSFSIVWTFPFASSTYELVWFFSQVYPEEHLIRVPEQLLAKTPSDWNLQSAKQEEALLFPDEDGKTHFVPVGVCVSSTNPVTLLISFFVL